MGYINDSTIKKIESKKKKGKRTFSKSLSLKKERKKEKEREKNKNHTIFVVASSTRVFIYRAITLQIQWYPTYQWFDDKKIESKKKKGKKNFFEKNY